MTETIPYINLLLLLIPLIISGWIYATWCRNTWEVGYATLRMIIQLLLIGYVLIFLFKHDDLWLGSLVLLVMIIMSTYIGVRPIKEEKVLLPALIAIGVSGTLVLGLIILGVLRLSPAYQPSILIPLAGMTYSNAMNTISLSGERYFTERKNGHPLTISREHAYRAALIPNINSFLAVGLVSLPGMMTGQILSGVSPLIAVRYQILVMAMVLGSAGISAAMFLWLIGRREK